MALQANKLPAGICTFALDLYQECARSQDENDVGLIVSPLSIASVLSLLAQGTEGTTLKEIHYGLHLFGFKETIAIQFAELFETLYKSIGSSTFSLANHIYVKSGYKIHQNFQEVAEKRFNSGISSLDFSQSDRSSQTINQFVSEKTDGKITNLITPDMCTDDTRVILVNAIYFKGQWLKKFDKKATKKDDFYRNSSDTIQVDFMHITDMFNYSIVHNLNATALEMKFAGSDISFVIILPNHRDGLSELGKKLKNYNLNEITDSMFTQKVQVTMPKFKIEFQISLEDILKKLGMRELFSINADLRGILETSEPLYVSKVIHKAFLDIDEEGGTAAAATAVVALFGCSMPTSTILPVTFRADHPFFYYLFDNRTKTVLFNGHVKF